MINFAQLVGAKLTKKSLFDGINMIHAFVQIYIFFAVNVVTYMVEQFQPTFSCKHISLCLARFYFKKHNLKTFFHIEKKNVFALNLLFCFVFENDNVKRHIIFRFQTKTTSCKLVVSFSGLKKRKRMTKHCLFNRFSKPSPNTKYRWFQRVLYNGGGTSSATFG